MGFYRLRVPDLRSHLADGAVLVVDAGEASAEASSPSNSSSSSSSDKKKYKKKEL